MTEPKFNSETRLAAELLGARLKEPEPLKKRPYTITNKDMRGERLKEHQWKPGQSGNPKGRPVKSLSLVSLLRERLENHPEEGEAIINALVSLAKRKNLVAIESVMNRIDGKVAETHKIEGILPVTLIFVPAAQILPKPQGEIVEGQVRELTEGSEFKQ